MKRKEEALRAMERAHAKVRRNVLMAPSSTILAEHLPRQARDKHRENSQNRDVFSQAIAATEVDNPHRDDYTSRWGAVVGVEPFDVVFAAIAYEKEHLRKTGSGQRSENDEN